MSEINEFLAVKTKDLETVTTEGEEFVLVTQKGRTRNAKIKDVRHVADDLNDEDVTKAASNLNLKKEKERAIESEDNLNKKMDTEINRSKEAESNLEKKLDDEIKRSISAENILNNSVITERDRAKNAEKVITDDLEKEVNRANNAESILTSNLANEINRAKEKESLIDNELANRYTKDKVYTKEEVLAEIERLINNAPAVLDTFGEIANALGNDPNFSTTIITMLSQKVDKINGKGLSTNDFTDDYKNQLIDGNNKKHTHDNKSIIDTITQTLINSWNSAYSHISDTIKHITSAERTLWNTVSNKAEKSHTHTKSQITDMPTKVSQFTNDSGYITASDIDSSQNHTHANKTVLDGITSNKVNSWDDKLSLSGGKVTGKTKFSQGTNVAYMATTTISGIYKHVAKITVRQNYQNQPITLDIIQRARFGTVIIEFKNSNTNDPELRRFTKIGELEAYLYKSATSTWELYIKMTEQYDCIDIMEFNKGEYMNLVDVTWTADTVTDLPTGYIKADRAYMDMTVERSVRDTDGNQINTTYVKKGAIWGDLSNK